MNFLAHENFPHYALKLLREFEAVKVTPNDIQDVATEYGAGASVEDWLDCAGKQGAAHRPTILIFDDGIKANAVGVKAMRESRCNFVVFAKRWMAEPWNDLIWRLLKAWPTISATAQNSKDNNQRCRIEVTINGKIVVTNL